MKITNKVLIIIIAILILLLIISISISIVNNNKNKEIIQHETKKESYTSDVVEIESIKDKKENEVLVAILDEKKDDNVIVIGADSQNSGQINNVVENNISPYYIKINVQSNVITIYKKDGNGNYNIPLKSMICSCGMTTQTEGTYSLKKYNNWEWKTIDNGYGRYATQITGDILINSVPYTEKGNTSSLKYEEYDKLGTYTSSKSILLTVADAKWIYENCPPETQVTFYTSEIASPLNVTKTQLISEDIEVRGWDPTDPDENNPWKTYVRPERKPETNNQENNNENQNTTQNTTNETNNTGNNNVQNNNAVGNNTLTNSTNTNNVSENNINNNTIDNNIQNNQTTNNTVVENRVLEENNDVTIKSEIIDMNIVNN